MTTKLVTKEQFIDPYERIEEMRRQLDLDLAPEITRDQVMFLRNSFLRAQILQEQTRKQTINYLKPLIPGILRPLNDPKYGANLRLLELSYQLRKPPIGGYFPLPLFSAYIPLTYNQKILIPNDEGKRHLRKVNKKLGKRLDKIAEEILLGGELRFKLLG